MTRPFRWVTDVGVTEPDQGRGGRYLFVGPDYQGPLPNVGFHIVRSQTYMNWLLTRAFVGEAGLQSTVDGVKATMKIYPLADLGTPQEEVFVNLTGNEVNRTSRAMTYQPRDRDLFFWEYLDWYTSFVGGSHEILINGGLDLNYRTMFHDMATGITPAMSEPQVGSGSVYAFTPHDADDAYLDGGKTYKVRLPAPVPANDFWSFVVYDNQHRLMLETDQRLAGLDSTLEDLVANEDGSYTVWFGPEAPKSKDGNWIQTIPGKSFSTILRHDARTLPTSK